MFIFNAAAVASIVIGVPALAQVTWFPTGALVFGAVSLAIGLFARTRLPDRSGVATVGAALGGSAIVAAVIVVAATTTW